MAELDQVGDAVKEYLEETGQVEMQFSSEDEIALDYENSDICYAG
jgi:sorbitol-specific phosphotransferase system component IIA